MKRLKLFFSTICLLTASVCLCSCAQSDRTVKQQPLELIENQTDLAREPIAFVHNNGERMFVCTMKLESEDPGFGTQGYEYLQYVSLWEIKDSPVRLFQLGSNGCELIDYAISPDGEYFHFLFSDLNRTKTRLITVNLAGDVLDMCDFNMREYNYVLSPMQIVLSDNEQVYVSAPSVDGLSGLLEVVNWKTGQVERIETPFCIQDLCYNEGKLVAAGFTRKMEDETCAFVQRGEPWLDMDSDGMMALQQGWRYSVAILNEQWGIEKELVTSNDIEIDRIVVSNNDLFIFRHSGTRYPYVENSEIYKLENYNRSRCKSLSRLPSILLDEQPLGYEESRELTYSWNYGQPYLLQSGSFVIPYTKAKMVQWDYAQESIVGFYRVEPSSFQVEDFTQTIPAVATSCNITCDNNGLPTCFYFGANLFSADNKSLYSCSFQE